MANKLVVVASGVAAVMAAWEMDVAMVVGGKQHLRREKDDHSDAGVDPFKRCKAAAEGGCTLHSLHKFHLQEWEHGHHIRKSVGIVKAWDNSKKGISKKCVRAIQRHERKNKDKQEGLISDCGFTWQSSFGDAGPVLPFEATLECKLSADPDDLSKPAKLQWGYSKNDPETGPAPEKFTNFYGACAYLSVKCGCVRDQKKGTELAEVEKAEA